MAGERNGGVPTSEEIKAEVSKKKYYLAHTPIVGNLVQGKPDIPENFRNTALGIVERDGQEDVVSLVYNPEETEIDVRDLAQPGKHPLRAAQRYARLEKRGWKSVEVPELNKVVYYIPKALLDEFRLVKRPIH